ncbi:hypothetical protein [Clostridium chrysemydis]|uniref:hypothetical protein n=1 Tax=Clostridium chrysemydis TaxID=2665504 RepID=UPI001883AFE5|nr:hypothetical protein [Clostridium chrysemydis]
MKTLKRSLGMLLLFMGLLTIPVSANPLKEPILVGEVMKVQESRDGQMKVLVCGYLNGCDIYKGEVCVLVNKDTKISMGCEKGEEKCKDIKIKQGDLVSVALDKKMTKSIPPQANAKRVKITRCDKVKKEEMGKDKKTSADEVKEEKAEKSEEKTSADEVKESKEDLKKED